MVDIQYKCHLTISLKEFIQYALELEDYSLLKTSSSLSIMPGSAAQRDSYWNLSEEN